MKLINYLPEYMRGIREYISISDCESPVFESFNDDISNLQYEMFAYTASEEGIKRFENMLDIKASEGDDLEDRRLEVIIRLSGGKRQSLAERLDELVGENNYTIELNKSSLTLTVRITVKKKSYLESVKILLDRIVPLNVILDIGILYASHKMTGKYTHKFLSGYTNENIKLIGIQQ